MKIHIVKKGDTLYELSQKYGVSLSELIEANPQIKNPDVIQIGDKIKIPTKKPYFAKPSAENKPLEPIKKEILEPIKKENLEPVQKEKVEPIQKEKVEPIQKEKVEEKKKEKVEEQVVPKEPFAQFHVPAQPVQSFYDLPKVPDVDGDVETKPMNVGNETYPGLSALQKENITAPYGEMPKLDYGSAGHKMPFMHPHSVSPNMYVAQPMVQPHNVGYHASNPPYMPYQATGYPMAYTPNMATMPSMANMPNVPNMPVMPIMTHAAKPIMSNEHPHNVVMPPPMPADFANVGMHMQPFVAPHYMMSPVVPTGAANVAHHKASTRETPEPEPETSTLNKEEKVQIKAKKDTTKKKKVKKSRRKKGYVEESWMNDRDSSYPWLNI